MGKKIKIVLGVAIVASTACYYTFHHFVDRIDLPALAAEQARVKYGLDLRMDNAAWTLWPAPGVTISGLDLSEPASQAAKPSSTMARASTLRGSMSWGALLSGRIEIDSIELLDGRLVLDIDAAGASPWSRLARRMSEHSESTTPSGAPQSSWSIHTIHVRNIATEIKRPKTKDISTSIEDMKLTRKGQDISWKSKIKALDESLVFDGSLAPAGEGFEFKTSIDSKPLKITASGSAQGSERISGHATLESNDLAAVGRWIHATGLSGQAKASLNFERTGESWRVDSIDAHAMGWSAKGSANLPEPQGKSQGVWSIKARVTGPSPSASAAPSQTDAPKAKTMIPWNALDLPEMNVDIEASHLPGLPGGTLSTQSRVGSGRFDARSLTWNSQAARFDGKAAATSKDRSIELSGAFSGMSLESLAGASTIKGGNLTGSGSVRSRGDSLDDLIDNLSGTIQARSGPASVASGSAGALGALMGAQFPWANKAGSYMQIDCAAMSARIERGVATGAPIMGFDGPALGAVGSGIVDLKSKTLDIGIDVRPKSGLDIANLSSFASALRIKGSLASPNVSVDPTKAGKGLAAVGAAASTGGLSLIIGALAKKSESQSGPSPCSLTPEQTATRESKKNNDAAPAAPKPNNPLDSIKGLFGFGKK